MQGTWKLATALGKEPTDKTSGNKLTFEGEVQMDMFDGILSARHAEQFGKLTLHQGSKLMFDAEVKLIRTDKREKLSEAHGIAKLQVTPTMRMDAKQFGALYGAIGTTFEAEFIGKPADEPAGDGRPEADDNVVPDSTAAHMKANARAKAGAGK